MTGIRYWRTTDWPQDFHNSYYEHVLSGVRITNGTFDLQWWDRFYPILHDWRATRPASRMVLTTRAQERFQQLGEAWSSVIAPNLSRDIETLEWKQIAAFPLLATEIKPLKYPSPVFTSKFCHFLAPSIFPIVDNAAMGNPFATYAAYFTKAREEWLSTDSATQVELIGVLTQAIGAPLFSEFPMKCKLIELCLIGRYAERS
jgi:hypothetical protein